MDTPSCLYVLFEALSTDLAHREQPTQPAEFKEVADGNIYRSIPCMDMPKVSLRILRTVTKTSRTSNTIKTIFKMQETVKERQPPGTYTGVSPE